MDFRLDSQDENLLSILYNQFWGPLHYLKKNIVQWEKIPNIYNRSIFFLQFINYIYKGKSVFKALEIKARRWNQAANSGLLSHIFFP